MHRKTRETTLECTAFISLSMLGYLYTFPTDKKIKIEKQKRKTGPDIFVAIKRNITIKLFYE